MIEYEICEHSHKRCYSYDNASEVLKAAKSHKNRSSTIPKRAYYCHYCNQWHLTSSYSENTRQEHKPLKILNVQEDFDLAEVL